MSSDLGRELRDVLDRVGDATLHVHSRTFARAGGPPRPTAETHGTSQLAFERLELGLAGNEMLVLDAAKRYPNATFFGLNPGLIKTNIRDNFLGKDTLRSRVAEWLIGLMNPSPETYAERIMPLLVSPDLEARTGAMFESKGFAILPTPKLTDASHVKAFIAASEALVSRANLRVS